MVRSKRSGLVAICMIAIVLLGTAIGLAVAGLPGADASARPDEEVSRSICLFEGTAVPNLRLMPSLPGETIVRVMSDETQYMFNPQSGRIEMAVYAGNLAGNDKVLITLEEAEAIATEFAQTHCENLSIYTLARSELKGFDGYPDSTATVMKAYDFQWIQVIDGALTPNRVFVSVNPCTGKVVTYINRYQPIESAGSPALTEKDAKAVVASRILAIATAASKPEGNLSPKVVFQEESKLCVVFKDGKQILVWRVVAMAQGDLPCIIGGQYDVDAQNGSIVEENPYL
jgi:hypothetical protein